MPTLTRCITSALMAVLTAGCATDHSTAARQHYAAQNAFQAANPQKPVLSLEAQAGQTLEIRGLKKLEVYAGNHQPSPFVPYVERPSEALQVFNTVMGAVAPVAAARVQALGAIGLVQATGGIASQGLKAVAGTAQAGFQAGTVIAGQIQAPGAVTTNHVTNSQGVNIGAGSAQTIDRHDTSTVETTTIDNSQHNPNNSVNQSHNPVDSHAQANPVSTISTVTSTATTTTAAP